MASRTKLTPEITDKLCRAIRMGHDQRGCSIDSKHRKINVLQMEATGQGCQVRRVYRDLWDHIKKAEVECKAILLKRVHDAASGNQEIVERREVVRDGGIVEVVTVTTTEASTPVWQAAAWISGAEVARGVRPQPAAG